MGRTGFQPLGRGVGQDVDAVQRGKVGQTRVQGGFEFAAAECGEEVAMASKAA